MLIVRINQHKLSAMKDTGTLDGNSGLGHVAQS